MTPNEHATYWLLAAPWLCLAAQYCWDYGMELLVPVRVTE